jgi:GAF domain-containing protein
MTIEAGKMIQMSGGPDLQLPPAVCKLLCMDLPQAANLNEAMNLIEQVRHIMLGNGLLTVNGVTPAQAGAPEGFDLQRLWSSNTDAYPLQGRKFKTMTPWTRQLLRRAEVFIAQGDAQMVDVFDDHERIAALGLHAIVNVPLMQGGRCVATLNVLSCRCEWQPHELLLIHLLAVLATSYVMQTCI